MIISILLSIVWITDICARGPVKITPSDGEQYDYFGYSVSIDGDYAIVGAYGDDDNGDRSGSAYIYYYDGSSWTEQDKIIASDGNKYDWFGSSVDISGDYAIVGAHGDGDYWWEEFGAAYIFHRSGSTWTQQVKLAPSSGKTNDMFGYSVAISGDYAIVGAYGTDADSSGQGCAYIYHRSGTSWTRQDSITATDGGYMDAFGQSVDIDGDYAIIGAPDEYYSLHGPAYGSAYIFERSGTSWSQQAKLTASDAANGDRLGYSVSINGDYAIAGAYYDDDHGEKSGSAYIFEKPGGGWSDMTETHKVTSFEGEPNDQFGNSVSIYGDYALVGCYGYGTYWATGAAYTFLRGGSSWTHQAKVVDDNGDQNDYFGYSVSISDDFAIVGSYAHSDTGAAYIYDVEEDLTLHYNVLLCWNNDWSDDANRDSLRIALQAAVDYGTIPDWDEYCRRDTLGMNLTLWPTIVYSEVAGIANNEADILMNFLDAGTASAEKTLIIAGDDIAYRQRSHSGQSDYEFCHDYLHALYRKNDGQGSSGMHSIIGVAINPGIVDSIDSGDPDVVSVLAPADTGYVFGPDCDEPDSACCVVYDGATYNTIYYTMEWQDIKADIIQVFLGPPGDRTQGNFGWTGNAGGTLPVELASFTVTVANQFVTLQWTTQTETDNLGFNVLRATTDEVNDAVKVNHNIISGQGTSSVPTEYSYVDNSELIPETTYWYWLESIDYQGNSELYGSISVKFELEEEPSIIPELPDKYGLFQNYPNPFNPNTQIYFRIAEECHGELSIYNIKGEKLATLYEGNIEKDKVITVSWDGKDETGKEVGSGIYFYKLETDKKSYLRKMIILK